MVYINALVLFVERVKTLIKKEGATMFLKMIILMKSYIAFDFGSFK